LVPRSLSRIRMVDPQRTHNRLHSIRRFRCRQPCRVPSPHFSPQLYCNTGFAHVYCVALGRSSRRPDLPMSTASHSVGLLDVPLRYACDGLGRAPCIHRHLRRFVTTSGQKSGLVLFEPSREDGGSQGRNNVGSNNAGTQTFPGNAHPPSRVCRSYITRKGRCRDTALFLAKTGALKF